MDADSGPRDSECVAKMGCDFKGKGVSLHVQ